MPELPDLVHIVKRLGPALAGRAILGARVKEAIVLRLLEPGSLSELLAGERFVSLERRGPFLRFELARHELVMHLMLAGRLRLAPLGTKKLPFEALAIDLEGGDSLSYADEKNMGKVYLCPKGRFEAIPGYLSQGVDLMSPEFDYELFTRLIAKKRNQARVFIMDQSLLSAVGNAYADEILFEAGIHPKTPCYLLSEPERRKLFESIRKVLDWGIEEVEKADRPLEEKVRGHLKVRNRGGEACPRCGATIRKAGVLGFDSFFCPRCQPDKAGRGFDWGPLAGAGPKGGPDGE